MTPLTREQVAHLVCDGGDDSAELYLQHDAALRQQVADLTAKLAKVEQSREEWKAGWYALSHDSGQQLEALTAKCEKLEQIQVIDKNNNDEYREIRAANLAVIHALTAKLAALQLHWSTAKPTVPGQYWWRAGADIGNPECMYVEHIRLWKGQLVNAYTLEPPEDGEWAGPLVPPEEAR
jgi:hypothetical protein